MFLDFQCLCYFLLNLPSFTHLNLWFPLRVGSPDFELSFSEGISYLGELGSDVWRGDPAGDHHCFLVIHDVDDIRVLRVHLHKGIPVVCRERNMDLETAQSLEGHCNVSTELPRKVPLVSGHPMPSCHCHTGIRANDNSLDLAPCSSRNCPEWHISLQPHEKT